MEVRTPLPTSPDFHFTFYPYTSAPASPSQADATHNLFGNCRPQRLQTRGRTSLAPNSPVNIRRKSRSFSPSRDESFFAKDGSPSANPLKCGLSKKWPRLKDLLLFRSASEGRVSGRGSKDALRKYTVLASDSVTVNDRKEGGEDKNVGRRRRSQAKVSAHEKHYTANRAAAEEKKRKTPLPFQRHGLISFIDLSSAVGGRRKVVSAGASSPFAKGGF